MNVSSEFIMSHLYQFVSDKLTETAFESEIIELGRQTGSLLNESVMGYSVLVKNQRNPVNISDLENMKEGNEISVNVKVDSIEPKRDFIRKDGTPGKVLTLKVVDKSGSCRLILWDTNLHELIDNGDIKKDSNLLIIKSRYKNGNYGCELTPVKGSKIIVLNDEEKQYWDWLMARSYDVKIIEKKIEYNEIKDLYAGDELARVNLKGTVKSVGTFREFSRPSGDNGYVINIHIYDGTGEAILTLWDKMAKENRSLKIGDMIELLNGRVKIRDETVEVHSDYMTRLKVK